MMIVLLLMYLIFFFLIILFVIAPFIMLLGKIKKNHKLKKNGFRLFMIPFFIFSSLLIYYFMFKTFAIKPDATKLIGKYHIVNSNSKKYGAAQLQFMPNREFKISNISNFEICESGRYTLYEDEIWFSCNNRSIIAKIDRGWFDFKIKFINGLPVYRQSIIFEKD